MPAKSDSMIFALIAVILIAGVLISLWEKRRNISARHARLSGRSVLSMEILLLEIASSEPLDSESVERELVRLADALSVQPGLLRGNDVVQDLIGKDRYAGDAVLEIEQDLQKVGISSERGLTVRDVITALAKV